MTIVDRHTKREEVYAQSRPGVIPYGDFGKNCIETKWREKYTWFTPESLTMISLARGSHSNFNALEATLEIMPSDAEIPEKLAQLLERNAFVRIQ
jgi:hypothetical protein